MSDSEDLSDSSEALMLKQKRKSLKHRLHHKTMEMEPSASTSRGDVDTEGSEEYNSDSTVTVLTDPGSSSSFVNPTRSASSSQVCIVQKKDSKQMFAMKYMNKHQCMERDALKNVLREVEILTRLEHPFLVNIWFSFQDEEDLFMVTDLLLGGDLRYHIQQEVNFSEEAVKLMVCELALALDYLQSKKIIHRDIKPDNILLDEEGHFHITDFNIATVLEDSHLATSMSGTKPYIAPEIFDCAMDLCVGYSYPVDWWSLGVVAYEMLRGMRPFDIHSSTSIQEVRILFQIGLDYPTNWSEGIIDLISKLLCVSPGLRISNMQEVKQVKCLKKFDMERVFQRQYKPYFTPPKDHLNCDPTFELEEMIIETKPLHKKKKRLAKQRSIREIQGPMSIELDADSPLDHPGTIIPDFKVYNRYQELEKRERERKELAWERELELAMRSSEPLKEETEPKERIHKCTGCPKLESVINAKCKIRDCDDSESKKSQLGLSQPKNEEISNVNDIQTKLQNIDFIDRTPSPVERTEGT